MCRLFVWNDPVAAAVSLVNRYQVGHVIDVLEDGQFGGEDVEGKNATGQFQVIELPGVPAAKYQYLCSGDNPELVPATVHPRLRINILDMTAARGAVLDEQAVLDRVTVVQPVPVDVVIGDNPLVIG